MQSNTTNKVLSNLAWLMGNKLSLWGLGLLVGVWVARYIGVENLGKLNYALAVIYLCKPVVNLGLASIVVREVVTSPEKADTIMGTAFAMQLVVALLLFTGINLYLWSGDEVSDSSVLISLLSPMLIFHCFLTVSYTHLTLPTKA